MRESFTRNDDTEVFIINLIWYLSGIGRVCAFQPYDQRLNSIPESWWTTHSIFFSDIALHFAMYLTLLDL